MRNFAAGVAILAFSGWQGEIFSTGLFAAAFRPKNAYIPRPSPEPGGTTGTALADLSDPWTQFFAFKRGFLK
jgi:hypothetical protein